MDLALAQACHDLAMMQKRCAEADEEMAAAQLQLLEAQQHAAATSTPMIVTQGRDREASPTRALRGRMLEVIPSTPTARNVSAKC